MAGVPSGMTAEQWAELEPMATAFVDRIVGPNEVTEDTQEAYDTAVALAAVKFAEYGTDAVGGFSIGSFSMGGGTGGHTGRDIARDAVMDVLVPAGLAYMGVAS